MKIVIKSIIAGNVELEIVITVDLGKTAGKFRQCEPLGGNTAGQFRQIICSKCSGSKSLRGTNWC